MATSQAAARLGYLLNEPVLNQRVELLQQTLDEYDSQKDKIINSPIQRHYGRTAVHLAAGNGLFDCLELLLSYGGEL